MVDGLFRREFERFKDDQRACRALLEDDSGESIELSVIDIGAGGAALAGEDDTSEAPRLDGERLTTGRIKMSLPSLGKRKGTKIVDVGEYEVVREWGRGLGPDAGIAVRFCKPRSAWIKLMADERLADALAANND